MIISKAKAFGCKKGFLSYFSGSYVEFILTSISDISIFFNAKKLLLYIILGFDFSLKIEIFSKLKLIIFYIFCRVI